MRPCASSARKRRSAASLPLADGHPVSGTRTPAPVPHAYAGRVSSPQAAASAEGPDVESTRAQRSSGLLWFGLAVAAVVIAADQLSKAWAVDALTPGEQVQILGRWLQLTLVYNSGAAFSLAGSATIIITVIAVGISVFLVVKLRTVANAWWALAFGLMLGGALGNVIDRLTRAPGPFRGHVIDFLQLPNWPVFNVADMAVVSAAVLMAALALFGIPLTAEDAQESREAAAGAGSQIEADATPNPTPNPTPGGAGE